MASADHYSQKPFNRSWRDSLTSWGKKDNARKPGDPPVPIGEGPQIHQFLGALMEYPNMSEYEMGQNKTMDIWARWKEAYPDAAQLLYTFAHNVRLTNNKKLAPLGLEPTTKARKHIFVVPVDSSDEVAPATKKRKAKKAATPKKAKKARTSSVSASSATLVNEAATSTSTTETLDASNVVTEGELADIESGEHAADTKPAAKKRAAPKKTPAAPKKTPAATKKTPAATKKTPAATPVQPMTGFEWSDEEWKENKRAAEKMEFMKMKFPLKADDEWTPSNVEDNDVEDSDVEDSDAEDSELDVYNADDPDMLIEQAEVEDVITMLFTDINAVAPHKERLWCVTYLLFDLNVWKYADGRTKDWMNFIAKSLDGGLCFTLLEKIPMRPEDGGGFTSAKIGGFPGMRFDDLFSVGPSETARENGTQSDMCESEWAPATRSKRTDHANRSSGIILHPCGQAEFHPLPHNDDDGDDGSTIWGKEWPFNFSKPIAP